MSESPGKFIQRLNLIAWAQGYIKRVKNSMKEATQSLSKVWADFGEILPEAGVTEGEAHFRKIIPIGSGRAILLHVELLIYPGYAFSREALMEMLRDSCEEYYEYALSTLRNKTFVTLLERGAGECVGETVMSFKIASTELR